VSQLNGSYEILRIHEYLEEKLTLLREVIMDLVDAIFNIVFFLLVLYLISWFVRKIKRLEDTINLLNKKIDLLKDEIDKEKP